LLPTAESPTRPLASLDTSQPAGRTNQGQGRTMKLREFVANSLPRVRGRKKKNQNSPGSTATITAAAVAVATTTAASPQTTQLPPDVLSTTPHKRPKQDGNGNWFQVSETKLSFFDRLVGKDSPVKRLLGARDRHSVCYSTHGCESVVYQTLSDSKSSSTAVVVECSATSVEQNPVCQDVCQCDEDSYFRETCACEDSLASCDYDKLKGSSTRCEGVTSPDPGSCPGSQRAPRSRSRIRTNPWLPSPRPSPLFQGSGTSRWRRHRRHHSEVKASDVTDHLPFDPVHKDKAQYYSGLDSGVGETVSHVVGKRDSRRGHADPCKRHKPGQDTWLGPRDLDSVNDLSFESGSSQPQVNARKHRSKSKRHSSSSSFQSVDSAHFPRRTMQTSVDVTHSTAAECQRQCAGIVSPDPESPPWGWECRSVSPTVGNRDSACWGSDPETESACVRLSPSDDICVLTSNIEQLAHNISSEYEDALDTTFGSDRAKQDLSFDSLNVQLDAQCPGRSADENNHAEDKAEERTRGDVTAAITAGFHSLQSQSSHTTDASVQTDFADDEDDDLANSDSDWFLGAGSGCVTEEEGAADEESSVGEDGEDRKLWMIPDCMQDSTDTGYSSLSRDGQVDIDDELNYAYVENNSARNDNDPGRALLSWHHAPGCMDDPSNVSPSADDSGDLFDQPSDKLCAHSAPFASRDRPGPQREEQVSHDGGSGPVSYEDDFRGNLFVGTSDPLGRSDPDFAEFCCCDDSFSDLFDQHNRSGPASVPARRVITSRHRQSHYDNMVPYPYDVTRFGDVIHDEQGTVSATSTAKEVTSKTSAGSSEGRSCPHSSTPSYARTTAHSHADFAAEATTGSSFSPFL
ncbi:hypothetical protein BaRGS_00039722, partial [Batillaria attramentaria]